MEKMEIEKLILKVQGNDEQAFAKLYDEFSQRIYSFIKFKVTDELQAEDLLQEVFLKLWRGAKTLKTENLNFSAWLYQVASNTINDYFRKVYRRPQTVSLDPNIDIAGESDSSKSTEQIFYAEDIQKSLDKLSPSYKQVLELRFIQELSVSETAKAMNKNNLGIRVLQYRALKKVEKLVKKFTPR